MGELALTDRAVEVLRRASSAASRFDPDVRIRVRSGAEGSVVFELTDSSAPGDSEIDVGDGIVVLAEAGLKGVVDAGEHDTLAFRAQPPI